MSPCTSLEKREFAKLECPYSLGTDEQGNSAYSLETEGKYLPLNWCTNSIYIYL